MYKQFEKYMHAFSSIISMENAGCTISTNSQKVCSIREENGWSPLEYFNVHIGLLDLMQNSDVNERLSTFIERQRIVTNYLINFQQAVYSPPISHISKVSSLIREPGTFVLYPWGTIDHQVYFDLWHTIDDEYLATIFDLGAGREGEPVRKNYRPIQLTFEAFQDFIDYFNQLVTTQNEQPSIELYQSVYGIERAVCRECLPERRQTTGNCVVKNLLAAIKQDAIWLYGHQQGAMLFKEFYLELLKATLYKAGNCVKGPFLTQSLPSFEEVCSHIQAGQQTFTGTNCKEIAENIKPLYDSLERLVVLEKPRVSANPSSFLSASSRRNNNKPGLLNNYDYDTEHRRGHNRF